MTIFTCGPIDVKISQVIRQVNIGSTARKNNVVDQHRSQHVDGEDYSHGVVVFYISMVVHSVPPQTHSTAAWRLVNVVCILKSCEREVGWLVYAIGNVYKEQNLLSTMI